ncbi:MAG: winged helix-turn-helix domain-containing protein [Gammaproteobacteria bacterium]|nr:winged helix-turn-helix domain-containing protein [Gammaproteobacteria bacterium]
MTLREAIRDVLARADKPCRVLFIVSEIKRRGIYRTRDGFSPPRAHVQACISQDHKRDDGWFWRPSPGEVALAEWREPSANG